MKRLESKEMRILNDTSMETLERSLNEHLMLSTTQTLDLSDAPGDSARALSRGTIAGQSSPRYHPGDSALRDGAKAQSPAQSPTSQLGPKT
ncbi:hypothetical protein L6452_20527 [Arctium lappa]|uniref:Uncharacterized protein n=1 Tax=Arctium lappa TaxID=4217 RepID=A0ACB9BCF6_ARCLA|nr:hypothetical protein L6452_20527 [Arctium lappa]